MAFATPVAAVGLMLEFLGESEAGQVIEDGVRQLLNDGRLPGLGSDTGLSTAQIGNLIATTLSGI